MNGNEAALGRALAEAERELVERDVHIAALEAVAEAARDAEPWLVVPSDVPAQHHETLGRVRAALYDALTALDQARKGQP